jgi:hypothetical protein
MHASHQYTSIVYCDSYGKRHELFVLHDITQCRLIDIATRLDDIARSIEDDRADTDRGWSVSFSLVMDIPIEYGYYL